MFRLLICLFIFSAIQSQYVLDQGIYLGGGFSGTGNYLFQTINFEQDNPEEKTFKGTGLQYNVALIYAYNRRNFFEIAYGQVESEIRHESVLYDSRIVDKRLTSKRTFSELSTLYSYVFPSQNLIFGGGTTIYFPESSAEDLDLAVNGVLHIGLKYRFAAFQTIPYVSYAFPITNMKRSGNDIIKLGTLQFGLKLWIKIL